MCGGFTIEAFEITARLIIDWDGDCQRSKTKLKRPNLFSLNIFYPHKKILPE